MEFDHDYPPQELRVSTLQDKARGYTALHELKGQADAEHGRTLLSVGHDPDTYSAYLRLALPAEQYPATFGPGSIFARKPFFLPCLVVASFVLLDLVFAIFFLAESRGASSRGKAEGHGEAEDDDP